MIVFCEDCGAKNLLNPDQIRNNLVSFTCLTCQYKNAYQMDIHPKFKPDHSKQDQYGNALKTIISDSSIIGVFMFHKDNGIMDNYMPNILKESDLLFLGKHLINAHKESVALFPDSDQTIWGIGDKHLITKSVDDSLFIVITSSTPVLPNHLNQQIDRLGDLPARGASML